MKYSSLRNEIEFMDLKHKHEIQLLQMKQQQEKELLLNSCKHKYDDGTSAKTPNGVQWDIYYSCNICGKTIG